MKKLPSLLAAASLAACTTMPAIGPDAVARAQAAFDRASRYAEMLLPYMAPERAERVRLALALTQSALTAAKAATTPAERSAALREAEAGMTVVSAPE